jgi:AcrR family transcriptional regulator
VDPVGETLYLASLSLARGSFLRSKMRPAERAAKKKGTARGRVATVQRAANSRLSRRDWILAGQEMLRECGVSGVKLAPLTRRLSVSTGSFYHHFSDFDAYLGAIAEAFSIDRVQGLLNRARAAGDDPVGRIRALAQLSLEDHTFELDRAMRIWATMDQRAEITVRKAEELVLAFLTEAFRDLGFAAGEARLRAGILLSVNIMPLSILDPKLRRSFFKGALRLLTGQPDA